MADILCRWVNKEIEPDTQLETDNLSHQLSNGYPYGLILYKYGMQEDFNSFHREHSSEAKLNNFTLLEPTLRLMNIQLKPQSVSDIINQRGHAAVQLLYRLFISLGSSRSEVKKSMLQGQKASARAQLGSAEGTWYRDRLRQQTLRQSDLDFEALVRRYEEKRSREEHSLREKEAQREREEALMRHRKIAEQLTEGRMKRERQGQLYRSLKLSPLKIAPTTPSQDTGRPDRRLRSLTVKQNQLRAEREVSDQLEEFEKRQLLHLIPHSDLPSPSHPPPLDEVSAETPVVPAESESSLVSSITLSEASSLAEPDNRYVGRLQTGGVRRREMAQRRAARRRRILAEQLRGEECRAEEQKEELLVKRLMRQTQQEQRAATQLLQVKRNKDVIRENRANKQKQLEEERRREFSEALDREAQLAEADKALYSEQIKQQQELHKELRLQKEKKNAEKSRESCREIVLLFADLACKIAQYHEMTDRNIPAKILMGWKSLLLAGYSPFQNQAEEDYPPLSSSPSPSQQQEMEMEQNALLDEQDFLSYLYWWEEWGLSEEGTPLSTPSNLILQHIVTRLYKAAFPPPPAPTPPDLPRFQFTGCVIGPPFSGKSSVLSCLSQRTGILLLDPIRLVQEAIHAYKSNELEEVRVEKTPAPLETVTQSVQERPDKLKAMSGKKKLQKGASSGNIALRSVASRSSAKKEEEPVATIQTTSLEETPSPDLSTPQWVPSQRAVLGRQAAELLKRGDSLEDQLLVDILIQRIRVLPDGCSWIIDGFPKTLLQAQLLERQLSGYEPPSNPPKLRTSREARECGGQKLSILAQGLEHEQHVAAPRSYFQSVIFLRLPDKLAIRRGLGQQINKRTKDKYHIEFSPAPSSVKQADLSRVSSTRLDMLQYMLNSYAESVPALEEWFRRFGNAKFLEAANTIQNLTQRVEDIFLSSSQIPALFQATASSEFQETAVEEEPATQPEEQPAVRPGAPGWEYCDKSIPSDVTLFLANLWEATEHYYISACKESFSTLRQSQHINCKYIFQTREVFREYLKRPDQKQVIVSQFQRKYNDLSADLRGDREVKAEFHQRVEDLKKNHLWDISDKRKHNAELELAHIKENSWLEDNTGYLINLFISLLQTELSRCQDTLRLMHDYYELMRGRALSDLPAQIVVPLLELPDTQAVLESISGTNIIPATQEGEEAVEEQGKSVQRPALMPRYEYKGELIPSRDDKGKKKLDKKASEKSFVSDMLELESSDADEQQLLQAYCLTHNNVHSLCYSEFVIREEVEQERMEKDRKEVDDKSKLGKATPAKKGGKGTPVGKKGTKQSDGTPEPVVSETQILPEVLRARKEEDQLLEEFMEAVKLEESYSKYRMEQLKNKGVAMIRELKSKVTSLYGAMEDWIGCRFREEIASINELCQYIHQAIENEIKIKPVLNLSGTHFLIESSMVTYQEPPRARPSTPPEDSMGGSLTVLQLEALATSLSLSAPLGVISIQEFLQFLSDNSSKANPMPDFSSEQLLTVLMQISWDGHYVNWKNFVVSLARPYPAPTLDALTDTLRRFRDRYPSGRVTRDEYLAEHIWFQSLPRDPSQYQDPDAQLRFDRSFMMRSLFFDIYADPDTDLLDYEDLLLYFCAENSPNTGLLTAMSLLKGIEVPVPEEATPEFMSAISFSREELFKIFYYNQCDTAESDLSAYTAPIDIGQIFSNLDPDGVNELTYAQLLSHPVFTEIIHSNTLFYTFDPAMTIFNFTTAQHSETSLISEQPLS